MNGHQRLCLIDKHHPFLIQRAAEYCGGGGLRKKRVSDDDAADPIRSGGLTRTQQGLNDFKGGWSNYRGRE